MFSKNHFIQNFDKLYIKIQVNFTLFSHLKIILLSIKKYKKISKINVAILFLFQIDTGRI